jgi:anion-transporting  ArsA/GET3 family ATPase
VIATLRKQKVLICAGTGGVGKTTLSASLGVLAARSGIKTLVLTIDPAQRLAQALGIDSRPGEDVEVPGIAGLSAAMIDPRREFDRFVLGSVDSSIAKGLFNNRLYQQLVSNLNGSQEFTSLVRLLQSVQSGRYELVILDTPPTQNAVDFLKAPERLYALFQDSVIGWFANTGHKESLLKRTLHRGTRIVTSALESVTGSTFIHELKDFFDHLTHLQNKVAKVSHEVKQLLHSGQTGFLLVTGFDETKLKEALEFQQDLEREKLRLLGVVVNRWLPEWTQGESRWPTEWDQDTEFVQLKEFYGLFSVFFKNRQLVFERFEEQLGGVVPVIKLPDFKNTVQGIEDLALVADTIERKWGGGDD